ncbi:hypothetical protein AB0J57_33545 [Streptomyces sp. NPDC049837]|uniref:hypothetical protein n=1 Tax=Streptomyces sp. NPDC049837 TaxID=3155277 RepID=UPI003435BB37
MTTELTEARLLEVWETGSGQEPPARALLLGALADGPEPAVPVADRTLGDLNALLLDLRESCFGTALLCATDCPRCEERLDVTVTTHELRALRPTDTARDRQPTGTLHADGRQVAYRALTGGDLLAVDPAAPDARRTLLARCVVDTEPAAADGPGDEVLEAVAERLAALDPGADTAVPLTCPYCHHTWSAAFDLAGYLWTEVEAYARRLLHEVHLLARVYGWTEADVLGVSPARRQYYLEVAVG